jgi:hypothetical protein
MSELGPYLSAFKNWKIRIYRAIWDIITEHWTSERWIRVTDDQNIAQFFQINKLQVDQWGHPAIVNAIGSMDVDFIVDEGPDAINQQADSASTLQALGPQFAMQFPELAIELSPLETRIKSLMLKKIQAKQAQPPPPDPKILALQAQQQLDQQNAQMEFQRKQAEFAADQQRQQQEAQFDRQHAQDQAQFDAQVKAAQAQSQMAIEQRKAEHQLRIESMKAAAQIQIAREKTAAGVAQDAAAQAAKAEEPEPEPEPAKPDYVAQILERLSKPKRLIRDGKGLLVGIE